MDEESKSRLRTNGCGCGCCRVDGRDTLPGRWRAVRAIKRPAADHKREGGSARSEGGFGEGGGRVGCGGGEGAVAWLLHAGCRWRPSHVLRQPWRRLEWLGSLGAMPPGRVTERGQRPPG